MQRLSNLALDFGAASRTLGYANGTLAPIREWEKAKEDERAAWQKFSDALWGKDSPEAAQAAEGIKSAPAGPFPNPAKIDTGDDGIGLLGGAPR
jgi:hypothetical protein